MAEFQEAWIKVAELNRLSEPGANIVGFDAGLYRGELLEPLTLVAVPAKWIHRAGATARITISVPVT